MQERLTQGFLQTLALVVAAVTLAATVNWRRPHPLPWVGDWKASGGVEAEKGALSVVSLEEARAAFFSGEALFVDARDPETYREGHILGAVNLPWMMFDEAAPRVLSNVAKEQLIITYCDGEGCGLSREVAVALAAMGYQNVRVLVNGWTVWIEAGLPTGADD